MTKEEFINLKSVKESKEFPIGYCFYINETLQKNQINLIKSNLLTDCYVYCWKVCESKLFDNCKEHAFHKIKLEDY